MAKVKTVPTADDSALIDREVEYEKNVREVGMSPYNAALSAGFSHTLAMNRQAEDLASQIFGGMDFKGIAERKKITPMRIIEYLATRAGFFDREEGAKKVVSLVPMMKKMQVAKSRGSNTADRPATPDDLQLPGARELEWDWVEVPDDSVQQKYMAMLLEFLEYSGNAKPGTTLPVGAGARTIELHFHVLPEQGKEIATAAVHALPEAVSQHFRVVDL